MAVGIAVGYVLGRNHRLRWAAMLGVAAATGRLNGLGTQLMGKGADMLRSTPELSRLADSGQQQLEAGRGAALSAMNSRMDSMQESLKDRAGHAGRFASGDGDGTRSRRGGGRRAGEQDDQYDEREDDDRVPG